MTQTTQFILNGLILIYTGASHCLTILHGNLTRKKKKVTRHAQQLAIDCRTIDNVVYKLHPLLLLNSFVSRGL